MTISFLFLARTHVNYEVKDDVAVIRINDPNSKVWTHERLMWQFNFYIMIMTLWAWWLFRPLGQHTVNQNAKWDGRSDEWSVGKQRC